MSRALIADPCCHSDGRRRANEPGTRCYPYAAIQTQLEDVRVPAQRPPEARARQGAQREGGVGWGGAGPIGVSELAAWRRSTCRLRRTGGSGLEGTERHLGQLQQMLQGAQSWRAQRGTWGRHSGRLQQTLQGVGCKVLTAVCSWGDEGGGRRFETLQCVQCRLSLHSLTFRRHPPQARTALGAVAPHLPPSSSNRNPLQAAAQCTVQWNHASHTLQPQPQPTAGKHAVHGAARGVDGAEGHGCPGGRAGGLGPSGRDAVQLVGGCGPTALGALWGSVAALLCGCSVAAG